MILSGKLHISFLACMTIASSLAQAVPPKPEPAVTPYRFVDLMPSFWQFEEQIQNKDPQAKTALFRQVVIEPHSQVYEAVVADWLDGRNLTRYIANLEARAEALRRAESEFPERFHRSWTKFAKRLPDLKSEVTVYLIPAPSGGAVRPFGNENVVIFGLDRIAAEMISENGFDAFVEHELTHLYHCQVNAEMREMTDNLFMQKKPVKAPKLYQVLWLEGLAVFFSRAFNPGATMKEVLSSDTLPTEVKATWSALMKSTREHLDSTDRGDINGYVFGGNKAIPNRAGYYVGMLVAEQMAKKHSLTELTRLHGEELRMEIEQTLRKLEASNPAMF